MRCPALLAFALAASLPAQTAKRPMTFEDLQAMKRVSDPQISPSGKWVLFSVTDVDLAKNSKTNHLWVVPADGSAKETQLTTGSGESNGRFSPDGKWISFTEAPEAGRSMSRVVLERWQEPTGRTTGPVVPLKEMQGDVDGAIWSPDSKRLLVAMPVYPECSDKQSWAEEDACNRTKDEAAASSPVKAQIFDHLLYRHWNAYTGEKRSHVILIDLDAGAIRDLTPESTVGDAETPTFSLGGPLGYAWAPDSNEIAYVANLDPVPAASTNNDVFTLRLDDPAAKPVRVSTSKGSDDAPQYSPDGKYLAFRSQAREGYESDRFRLMLYDRLAKTTKELPKKLDTWVDEFSWDPSSKIVYFTSPYAGVEPVLSVDVDGDSRGEVAGLVQAGEFSSITISPDSRILFASAMKVDRPSTIVGIKTKIPADTMTLLTHLNDSLLAQLDLSKMESFTFPGAGGTKVQGFLIRPPNFDPSKKYPLKFLIHGGPQGAWGDAWSYRWNPELMAASGYVVVMINPRGSTGYGQAFIDGVNGDWGGKPYIDLMKGLDFAEARYPFIDKSRECALGASYGGYMANWVLTHTNRFACIVTHDGMYNPQSAYGDTEELWFNEWEFRKNGDKEPGQPWKYAAGPIPDDPFRKWSPMLSIQNAKTPTLVIHGQRDYRLDVSEGFQLFTALQRLHVPSKMLYFPDEGHWVLKPQNSRLWYETVNDWCDKYTHTNKYAAK
jgi:dipeptidyl aminopeptidase/acylaminoacyl peptidase